MFKNSTEEEKAWVLGQEVDISDIYGKVDFEKLREEARKKNRRWGYLENKDFDTSRIKKRTKYMNRYERRAQEEAENGRRLAEYRRTKNASDGK